LLDLSGYTLIGSQADSNNNDYGAGTFIILPNGNKNIFCGINNYSCLKAISDNTASAKDIIKVNVDGSTFKLYVKSGTVFKKN